MAEKKGRWTVTFFFFACFLYSFGAIVTTNKRRKKIKREKKKKEKKKKKKREREKEILFLLLLFFFLIIYNISLIRCGKFGSLPLGKATAAARAALPIPISVCSIFVCPSDGMNDSVWDF